MSPVRQMAVRIIAVPAPLACLAALIVSSAPPAALAAQRGSAIARSADPSSPTVVVDASKVIAKVTRDAVGTNLGIWYQVTAARLPAEIASVAPRILRWPGGSVADAYHWQNQTECGTLKKQHNRLRIAYNPRSTFRRFMKDIVIPGRYDVAITVNYGSNKNCTAGGDPHEAAAWVAYAKSKGYDKYIKYWTVGNEEYGGWEYDLHSSPHDPRTYAAAMSGPNGYYALMKAADPGARVGIDVTGNASAHGGWDSIVLAHSPYDFVELHYYAQQPHQESDRYLLEQAPLDLADKLTALRRELAAVGRPDTPIMLGEFNSVSHSPGKQSVSIVNALFTGLAYGRALDDGVAVATWWFGAGAAQYCHGNNSGHLYGWQDFGGYDLVAANSAYSWNGCKRGPVVPEGTIFPSGDAFLMVSRFAQPGASMLRVAVSPAAADVRAFADTAGPHGYALMLFNLNKAKSVPITVDIENSNMNKFSAASLTYDKHLYNQSRNNVWLHPVSASLGTVGTTMSVTLQPWSMTVVELK